LRNKKTGDDIMHKRFQALRRAAVISPLLMFILLSFAGAQGSVLGLDGQAAMLTPSKVITIRMVMSDNKEITVSQYDGEMIRTGPKNGEKLGITPRILDNGSVALDFFRVTKITKRDIVVGEAATSIGGIELNSALPQSTPIGLIYSIQLIGISEAAKYPEAETNTVCPCCVTCGDEESCGLSVQMSCGRCKCMNYN
jgi:hypothetical protein